MPPPGSSATGCNTKAVFYLDTVVTTLYLASRFDGFVKSPSAALRFIITMDGAKEIAFKEEG
jgi:hypothetical protein